MLWLCSRNECVELNFGQKPYRFDLEGLVREELEQRCAAVQRYEGVHLNDA